MSDDDEYGYGVSDEPSGYYSDAPSGGYDSDAPGGGYDSDAPIGGEQKFVSTFDQQMHSAKQNPGNVGEMNIDMSSMKSDREKKDAIRKAFGKLSPEDKLKYKVGQSFYYLGENSNKYVRVGDRGIETVCNKIDRMDKQVAGKLNPIAFILGYFVTDGGIGIDGKSMDVVLKNLNNIIVDAVSNEEGDDQIGKVTAPDVVRYARFWMNLRV